MPSVNLLVHTYIPIHLYTSPIHLYAYTPTHLHTHTPIHLTHTHLHTYTPPVYPCGRCQGRVSREEAQKGRAGSPQSEPRKPASWDDFLPTLTCVCVSVCLCVCLCLGVPSLTLLSSYPPILLSSYPPILYLSNPLTLQPSNPIPYPLYVIPYRAGAEGVVHNIHNINNINTIQSF
jgi:hypothetical protein